MYIHEMSVERVLLRVVRILSSVFGLEICFVFRKYLSQHFASTYLAARTHKVESEGAVSWYRPFSTGMCTSRGRGLFLQLDFQMLFSRA